MRNLAGQKNCNYFIDQELEQAGINVKPITEKHHSEVPCSLMGELGKFTFRRAWYYWVVKGDA